MHFASEQRGDVRIWRETDGTVRANVPHLRHHSPAGFECGYSGSGPADLALSILGAFVPVGIGGPSESLSGGQRCSRFAWQYHQEFKFEFIATLPSLGGVLSAAVIRAWIAARVVDVTEETRKIFK